jgi:hypothetical protein
MPTGIPMNKLTFIWNYSAQHIQTVMDLAGEEYKKGVANDFRKIGLVEKKLKRLTEELLADSSLWPGVVALGWTRMLESSDFPVLPDRVLKAGFSPLDWFLVIRKASTELSIFVAKRFFKKDELKEDKIAKILEIKIAESKEHLDEKVIVRIKDVLLWDEVLERLDEVGVKILAFLWVTDYLTSKEGVMHSEAEVEIQKIAGELLHELVGENEEEVIQRVERMVNLLREIKESIGPAIIEIAGWSEIIRFPW